MTFVDLKQQIRRYSTAHVFVCIYFQIWGKMVEFVGKHMYVSSARTG